MRKAFIEALVELADRDPRVVLLTADLGFTVVEEFARRNPDRFLNVGVAEQNMIGVATGLATRGFIPFCYSIATFASMRPYEQIRNGPVLHRLPVRIVGIGGGFAYGSAGITHHALEDIGLARLQPGLSVIAPAEDRQASEALRRTYDLPGPVYYRVGKDPISVVELDGRFRPGRLELIGEGGEVLLMTYGAITKNVVEAAARLERGGTSTNVAVVACLQPLADDELAQAIAGRRLVVTVEEHYRTGGLGSLVAEHLASTAGSVPLLRLGVDRALTGRTGSESWFRQKFGLTPVAIDAAACQALQSLAV